MTEESFADFKCPYCGDVVSFPKEYAGQVHECPLCTESLIVPPAGAPIGRKLPLPITTSRLLLRRLRGMDWKDLHEFMSDEELFRFQDNHPLSEDEITQWLETDGHVKLTTPDQSFCLGIELQGSDKLIGYLAMRFADAQRLQATFTLLMNRSFQRKGFGAEALVAGMAFCFTDIAVHRVTSYCDSRNAAALGLFKKAAMRQEGEFVQDRLVNGVWVNTVWFARLKEEGIQAGGAAPAER